MPEVPETLEGWYCLHDFRRVDWAAWNSMPAESRRSAVHELSEYLERAGQPAEGGSGIYEILGQKADLLFLHLRPTLEELSELERQLNFTAVAGITSRPYSYLSVTELSFHEATARGGTEDVQKLMEAPFVQRRLKPQIPENPYLSFYPMSKRRGEVNNWFALTQEERRVMMRQHALTGRKYQDRITQMITGSTGLDDWEWGVTLFATDPLALKKIVYEMRFDEVSAKYAEFGTFYTGIRAGTADLPRILGT